MGRYPASAVEKAMKVQEVVLRAIDGRIKWFEAAEILGVSTRTMRRWKRYYEFGGYDGLFDRRRRRPSPRAIPVETVQKVLELYREHYHDYNVRHFHEKLGQDHGITLSYQWVKDALQTAGLVAKKRKRGPHRRRRPRRPLQGMMVHCDGSLHGWIPFLKGQKQTMIVYMDDATNEVYSAHLADEESTMTMMAGLRKVLEKKGLFCSLYTDRASHFFSTPKAGKPVDKSQVTQIGRALQQLGIEHIPSYSPQARGRMERLFGTWQGRLPQELRSARIDNIEDANRYLRRSFIPWHNRSLAVPAKEKGSAFVPCYGTDLDVILSVQHERTVQNDNTVVVAKKRLQIESCTWRTSFAKCRVTVCEHLDGTLTVRYGPRLLGSYQNDGTLLKPVRKKKKAA